jgi:hypothetical protein
MSGIDVSTWHDAAQLADVAKWFDGFNWHAALSYAEALRLNDIAKFVHAISPGDLKTIIDGVNWMEVLGYAASLSVLITFLMSTMVPLRVVAIASNVLFASYGAVAHIYPVMILHVILLPINVIRLFQLMRLIRGIRAAEISELPIDSLLPFMTHRIVTAGHTLIEKGADADRMYYLARGRLKIAEIDKFVEAGAVLGEIGIFARDQKRMATVVCIEDCEIYELSGSKAKQLYFQDRAFSLAVLQLIIARLMEDIRLSAPSAAALAPFQGGESASAASVPS